MAYDRVNCWLIERHYYSRLHYWTGKPEKNPYAWTTVAVDAVRFAREQDAQSMLTWHLGDVGNVVQHVFVEEG